MTLRIDQSIFNFPSLKDCLKDKLLNKEYHYYHGTTSILRSQKIKSLREFCHLVKIFPKKNLQTNQQFSSQLMNFVKIFVIYIYIIQINHLQNIAIIFYL